MAETARSAGVKWIGLIAAVYVAIIFLLIFFVRIELDAMTAIRVYAGGEGIWAKAQKNAVLSLRDYLDSHDESDYQDFLSFMRIPLGDRTLRLALQKPEPDLDMARSGYRQGGNHPDDMDHAIAFFLRFQHVPRFAEVIDHWSHADQLVMELQRIGDGVHEEIVSGRIDADSTTRLAARLKTLNRQLTREEALFSSSLAEASRWANAVARKFTYLIAFLLVALGIGLSWPIVRRIKTTEDALYASEARYRGIFDHANDIIYTIEADSRISSISPSFERLMGWQPAEWIGRPFLPIVHPDDRPYMQQLFAMAMRGEPMPIFRVRLLMKPGGYLDTEIAATPVGNPGSVSILGVVRDITERKLMEDQIRRLNEELEAKVKERTQQLLEAQQELVHKEKLVLLGQVAANVGNELRNPLGVMSNAVFFLHDLLKDADPKAREYLDIIRDEIAGAETIVSDFLDATNPKPPHIKSVDVGKLLRQAMSRSTIPDAISVRIEIAEAIPAIRVDPVQMRRVFGNLISNSVAAMPKGGLLELRADRDETGCAVVVTVRDTGIGIAKETLAQLFEPLFTTKARGIGLGLLVVKNLVRANNGAIDVESETGRGTTFRLTLETG